MWCRPAGPGGAALSGGGLADGAASRCAAAGQRQQRGVHAGVPPGTSPQGREETLRQSGQKVTGRSGGGVPARVPHHAPTQPPSLFLRDPEFVFYDQLKQTMNAYRCVYQLLLAIFHAIVAHLLLHLCLFEESNRPFLTCSWPSASPPTWGPCTWPSRQVREQLCPTRTSPAAVLCPQSLRADWLPRVNVLFSLSRRVYRTLGSCTASSAESPSPRLKPIKVPASPLPPSTFVLQIKDSSQSEYKCGVVLLPSCLSFPP